MKPKKVIGFSNHKGGCGKSEFARNIAAQLAKRGNTVLIIDLDDQGSLSESFGFDTQNLDVPCITNVLVPPARGEYEQLTLDDIIINVGDLVQSRNPDEPLSKKSEPLRNVWLAPCNITFDAASPFNLVSRGLSFAIEDMETEFDYILLDCPPNLKIVTENAFLAADLIILPVEAGTPYITGVNRSKDAILSKAIAEHMRPADWKIVINVFDRKTIRDQMGVEEVQDAFDAEHISDTFVPACVKCGECVQIFDVVSLRYPNMPVSLAFSNLTEEIING